MGGGEAKLEGPDLTKGIPLSDLVPRAPLVGHADGESVLVVRIGDDVHAIGASCTHYGGPLAQGIVVGDTIRCPWHHACFDVRSGRAVGAPALADLPCFDVERRGNLVTIRTKRAAAPAPAPKEAPASVVVLGAGAAGAACVEMLRKEGYDGPITMLGTEEPGPVDRPNLSKDYLAGNAPDEWIPLGGRARWAELRAELVTDDPAQSLDAASKVVTTRSGRRVPYGALLYATGAEPIRLDIPGADAPHVLTLRTLADANAIIARATGGARRAVVIGSSFIGLEVASSLIARGLAVDVVGRDTIPLSRVLGPEVGMLVQRLHEEKGVRFHLGKSPKAIGASSVELDDGTALPCDFVVLGVGVKPRLDIAQRAGLTVDGGVVVDDQLRASAPAIWAAGDVARYPDPRAGERVRIEHWVVAERQGQAVARAMLGSNAPYRDVPFFWSAHYDLTVGYVGHAPRWDRAEVFGSLDKREAAIAYRHQDKVLAVATLNRDKTSLRVEAAMAAGDDGAIEAALRG